MANEEFGARQVSVGRVFERAFSTIRHNPGVTLGLAFVLGAIPGLLSTLLMRSVRGQALAESAATNQSYLYAVYGALVLSWVLALVIFALNLAMLTRATVAQAEGRRAGFGESLMAGVAVLAQLIAVAVLMAVAVMLGLVLLIVPGAILYVMWAVAVPVLIEERRGVFGAFGRSRELTRGARWKVFGTVAILVVVYYLISLVSAAIAFSTTDLRSIAASSGFDMPIGLVIVSIVVGTIVNALWATVQASLYVELRDWKDGPGTENLRHVFA